MTKINGESYEGSVGTMRWARGYGLFYKVCACLALLLVPSCGANAPQREEDEPVRASEAMPLAGSVTLSISTPYAVPPLAPVVTTRNSVYLGAGATVVSGQVVALGASGGGVHAEPDGVLNETWSRGLADLKDRVLLSGPLHAPTHQYGNGVVVPSLDASPAFEPQNSLTWTVTYPTSGTGPAITADPPPNPAIPPLAPGQYGDVAANSQGSLTFKSGTYYLRSLRFESASTITLDQAKGPVILYVETGALALRGAIRTLTNDPPDLLIVYLGTTDFSVETVFDGALVAPNASATLRAVSGIHTGFFYTKDFQILDAHARVQYRAPLSIVKAANPTGSSCAAMIRALVPAASQQAAIARYCGACASPADTDLDGTPDCLDGCPYDHAKTEPGICDCGISDTDDTDVDGFPNCIDRCPADPNNVAPGQCGCVGSRSLQPNGTPCSDTAGPQANATCNAGVCGNPTTSRPATGCRLVSFRSSAYWLCPSPGGGVGGGGTPPRTQTEAQQACSAKGLSLVRVDSLEENRFIQSSIKEPIWIGANSISAANDWRWSIANSNNGDRFWSGGATGTRVGSRFNYWAPGSPSSAQRCAVMMPATGRWSIVPCNQSRGYICEYRAPLISGTPIVPPGMPSQPPAAVTPCISETAAQLPDPGPNGEHAVEALATLNSQFLIADQGKSFPGPFLDPPQAGETCPNPLSASGITRGQTPDDADAGCQFVTGATETLCLVDSDCSGLGPNFLCRSVNDAASCSPGSGPCKGHTRCVTLSCPPNDLPCDQIEVCNPDSPLVNTSLQDPEALKAHELDPATFFAQPPNTAPSTAAWGGPQADPPHGPNNDQFGTNHAWCRDTPRQLPEANKALKDTNGQTNTGSKIQFGFKPDLTFRANPSVLAQGETNLDIFASASLAASVKLNGFLGQSFGPTDIFKATIGMGVQRCQIFGSFEADIFGQKFLDPEMLGLPYIDSRTPDAGQSLYDKAKACDQAVGKFQLYADHAKKAFRDAQTLLKQYKTATGLGKALQGNLCNAVFLAGSVDENFPGGPECADNEPPYVTVGRFLDYYQAPGGGQIRRLREAQMQLAEATNQLKHIIDPIELGFDGLARQESETVLSVQFFIGPIPMVLEVDVFAKYGIGGGFELKFEVPTGLVTGEKGPQNVAKVTAQVAPYAGAGLSAFVGAGVNLGALKASVGIEGALTLASISAPIFAGVGLDVEALKDKRLIHSDILDVAMGPDAFHFGYPTALRFGVNYEYGAGVDLAKILEGEINGKLRIKFFFFSRTWRKNIVRFKGFNAHFDLVKGGGTLPVFTAGESVPAHLPTADGKPNTVATSTNVASGVADTGLAETQAPLMVLAAPQPPPENPTETQDFDFSAVERLGYDGLCCSAENGSCQTGFAGRPQCCPGLDCVVTAPGGGGTPASGTCQRQCNATGAECNAFGNGCCAGLVCGSGGYCQQCGQANKACGNDGDCCSGLLCDPNSLTCKPDACTLSQCNASGAACGACGHACCGGLICDSTSTKCKVCGEEDVPCGNSGDCCLGLACNTITKLCYPKPPT